MNSVTLSLKTVGKTRQRNFNMGGWVWVWGFIELVTIFRQTLVQPFHFTIHDFTEQVGIHGEGDRATAMTDSESGVATSLTDDSGVGTTRVEFHKDVAHPCQHRT